jgi:putative PIG3 family NAD(P)H quinone oxidoreductase
MRAVVIREPGGPEVLEVRELPSPAPPYAHVRVRTRYVGVNRADLLQRLGAYPAPPGVPRDIPGLEYVGVVDALGEGARRFTVGERVFGLVAGGAYAEELIAHEDEIVRVPASLGDEEAASIPEAFVTAYDAMVVRGGLQPGERVLISAAGSGVGTAAVQIARALGCTGIGTSRTAEKLERAKALGLDVAIVATDGKFAKEVLAATGGAGVDVVLELVGGRYVAENLEACAPLARVVLVGLTGGRSCELDLGAVLRKRVSITGTVLRSRPLQEKLAAARLLEKNLAPWLAQGRVRGCVDRVFPLARAGEAHAYLATDASFGKVLLSTTERAAGAAGGAP